MAVVASAHMDSGTADSTVEGHRTVAAEACQAYQAVTSEAEALAAGEALAAWAVAAHPSAGYNRNTKSSRLTK